MNNAQKKFYRQMGNKLLPRVSIIIPAYNAARFLPACLESVLRGQGPDTEVIVVNDGSTDQSADVLDCYGARYPQLRVISQSNGGVSSARNAALDVARGDYVLFVDADDRLREQAVPKLIALAESSQADIIQFQICTVTMDGDVVKEPVDSGRSISYDLMSPNDWEIAFAEVVGNLLAWNGCYRRMALHGLKFVLNMQPGEDLLFGLQAFCRASSIVLTSSVLYNYVQNDTSAMHSPGARHVKSAIRSVSEIVKTVQASNHYQAIKTILFRKVRAISEGQVLGTLIRLDEPLQQDCWRTWFDEMGPVFVGTDLTPFSKKWLYRIVFACRSRTVAIFFLNMPMRVKSRLLRMQYLFQIWSAFRRHQTVG